MLFLPESVYEARRKLVDDLQAGKIGAEQMHARMLDLCPDDDVALVALGQSRYEGGDLRGAEEYFWRAIDFHPFQRTAYMQLAVILSKQPERQELSKGLTELALRKFLLDQEAVERLGEQKFDLPSEIAEILHDLDTRGQLGAMTELMRRTREHEPAEVTERLRPYRLIHDLQESIEMDAEFVDELVGEGKAILPLLVGVLRDWAQGFLPDDDECSIENTLAILGEIGDATVIPHLLEFIVRSNVDLTGAAGWAFDRICELHPEHAAGVIGEIASDLDGPERIAIAERLLRFRALDPSGRLFERLTKNVSRVLTEDRRDFFPVLLTTMIAALGRPGIEMARATLRRNAEFIPRRDRSECEDIITTLSSGTLAPPPRSEPSPWSVYDICSGEAFWEEDGEDDEMPHDKESDEMYLQPGPTRRPSAPGRNEPCWCGSGKKYKKCHLDADQKADWGEPIAKIAEPTFKGEFDRLRSRIGEFMTEVAPASQSRGAMKEFFGDEEPAQDQLMAFIDWMVHDRLLPRLGRTVMEEFLSRHGARLTPREREFVESSAHSFIGLYEVQDVEKGRGLTVKDLIVRPGDTFFVHDVSMSQRMVRWDGLLARVIHGERGLEFSGVGLTVPRRQLEAFREWVVEDRRHTHLPWPEYLKRNVPRIRRGLDKVCEDWRSSIQLANSDGEEFLFSNAVYRILDEAAVDAALKDCPELVMDEEGNRFAWLRTGPSEEGRTVLGSIRIQGEQLTLECNSKQRIERGKKMLAELAGPHLKHLRDEFTSQQELKRRAKEKPPRDEPHRDEIPPEVQRQFVMEFMERNMAEWPDKKIPALGGKTPREAVKTAAGRQKVEAILRDFENAEEHKRLKGEPSYDIDRLREELGIK